MLRRVLPRPEALLAVTFALLIAAGTFVLRLPVCHAGERIGNLDALFTATSAVCVTGLITKDTATDYSRIGQTVILILIQLGGLGVMTFGALAAQLFHRRVPFASQAALQDMLFQGELRGNLGTAVRRIVLLVFVVELLGTLAIYAGLRQGNPQGGGVFEAVFLSISAFCNAGFSVYSDSVMSLRGSATIMWTIMTLIVLGGLGYMVLFEMLARGWRWVRGRREGPVGWSLHAKVVLGVSTLLILGGALALSLSGLEHSSAQPGRSASLLDSLFQSITARTAGFNTVDIGALPVTSLLILVALMFVGGSPGSCAGGIKTTSLAAWAARIYARLRARESVNIAGRRVPPEIIRRAGLIIALALVWNAMGLFVLSASEAVRADVGFEELVFEQFSAFGTVGLSTGLTPDLSPLGKLWIIASMFVGRLGPLTIALAVVRRRARPQFEYPVERLMIG